MLSKRLLRQIKKIFGEEDYHTILSLFINENLTNFTEPIKEKIEPLLAFPEFIDLIEQAYNEDQSLLQRAQKNLETSSEELAQANKDLFKTNKIVEQMLNSLDQGFIIFDKNLKCLSLYTKATVNMLGVEVEGKKIQEILPFSTEANRHSFIDWCELVFMELHEFNTLQGLAPKRLLDEKSGKTLDLDFKTVKDANDVLLFITVILTDRTQEIINQNNANKMQEYAQMVAKIISDKKTTYDYIFQMKRLFVEKNEIVGKEKLTDEDVIGVKRLLHTIKGAGNTYFFGDLGRMINDLELKLNDMFENSEIHTALITYTPKIIASFEEYLKQVSELTTEVEKPMSLAEKDKDWLHDLLKNGLDESYTKERLVFELNNYFILSPIQDYVIPYRIVVSDLAKRLDKSVPFFEMTGENVRVNYEKFADFFSALVHIFRNIMDHGIENDTIRIVRGKKKAGRIITHTQIVFGSMGERYLEMIISDDGSGIDVEKIKGKLKQSEKYKKNYGQFSSEELMNMIFDHGFSTAEKKTDISGQGVGLDALKAVVIKLGGRIRVDSTYLEGTIFTITLPY